MKGFGVIHRFSEDIDIRIRIEPFGVMQVDTHPNHEKPQHIESRRVFYYKLRRRLRSQALRPSGGIGHTMTKRSGTLA